jgi:hypothetical protein
VRKELSVPKSRCIGCLSCIEYTGGKETNVSRTLQSECVDKERMMRIVSTTTAARIICSRAAPLPELNPLMWTNGSLQVRTIAISSFQKQHDKSKQSNSRCASGTSLSSASTNRKQQLLWAQIYRNNNGISCELIKFPIWHADKFHPPHLVSSWSNRGGNRPLRLDDDDMGGCVPLGKP